MAAGSRHLRRCRTAASPCSLPAAQPIPGQAAPHAGWSWLSGRTCSVTGETKASPPALAARVVRQRDVVPEPASWLAPAGTAVPLELDLWSWRCSMAYWQATLVPEVECIDAMSPIQIHSQAGTSLVLVRRTRAHASPGATGRPAPLPQACVPACSTALASPHVLIHAPSGARLCEISAPEAASRARSERRDGARGPLGPAQASIGIGAWPQRKQRAPGRCAPGGACRRGGAGGHPPPPPPASQPTPQGTEWVMPALWHLSHRCLFLQPMRRRRQHCGCRCTPDLPQMVWQSSTARPPPRCQA